MRCFPSKQSHDLISIMFPSWTLTGTLISPMDRVDQILPARRVRTTETHFTPPSESSVFLQAPRQTDKTAELGEQRCHAEEQNSAFPHFSSRILAKSPGSPFIAKRIKWWHGLLCLLCHHSNTGCVRRPRGTCPRSSVLEVLAPHHPRGKELVVQGVLCF